MLGSTQVRKMCITFLSDIDSPILDEPVDSSGMHANVNVIELESKEEPHI